MLLIGLVALAACAPAGGTSNEAPELTEEYGCGFGFYAGNAEQTAGMFVTFSDFEGAQIGEVPETSQLDDGTWNARLEFGTDLFANWCDDVLEPGEPTPDVDETWQISGTIRIVELPESGHGLASAILTGVEARGPNDELIVFDDIEIENQFWGTVAG